MKTTTLKLPVATFTPPPAKLSKKNGASRVPPSKAKSRTTRSKDQFVLRLFVAGATDRSRQAILRVRNLCAAELKDRYKLEVIDIHQQPTLARTNQIVATPTLIIAFPPPLRRFIGNLTNIGGLAVELDLITQGKIP